MTAFSCDDHMILFLSQILTAHSNFYLPVMTTTVSKDFLDTLIYLDHTVFEWMLFHLNPVWLTRLSNFLVQDSTLGIIAAGLWIFYFTKNKKMAIYLLITLLIALGVSDASASLLKKFFTRMRPVTAYEIFYNPFTFSFPSAHATNSMTLAMVLWRHFEKGKYYFFILPLVVGVCRVISHYHFPGDVLGGWFFGAILGGVIGSVWLMVRSRIERRI